MAKNEKFHSDTNRWTEMFKDYTVACANFYGAISVKDVFSIIIAQNPEEGLVLSDYTRYLKGTRKANFQYHVCGEADVARNEPEESVLPEEDCWIFRFGITLAYDIDEFRACMEAMKGKPLCDPGKERLMEFKNEEIPVTPEIQQLCDVINLPKDPRGIVLQDFIANMVSDFHGYSDFMDAFNIEDFVDCGLELNDVSEAGALLEAIRNVELNWPVAYNRGYTPLQMKELMDSGKVTPNDTWIRPESCEPYDPGKFYELYLTAADPEMIDEESILAQAHEYMENQKKGITAPKPAVKKPAVSVPVTAPKKVGRNEPCPCGSGKKYKQCCGKNA